MADITGVTCEIFSCGTSRALALFFSHIQGHVSAPEGGFRILDPLLTQSRALGRPSRREIPAHVKAAKFFVAQSFAVPQPYVVLRRGVGLACKDWFRVFF
ncbi:hypothetical protein PENANT_c001G08572 [Penicillium antarcticum]|uniref:Uncharacterized protein n=1 Tax=Penicillium antarcticum TaxID=416450 RepID=A0A1V6QNL8_9EURO|nr:hypothetical protein PENANT_c001G08572 [Penicillium antarcticum]